MKKYLLTALLGVFGFVGAFASADTVDGFTSDSEIYKTYITQQIYADEVNHPSGDNSSIYLCAYSSPSPYTIYYDGDDGVEDNGSDFVSSSSVYCFPKLENYFNGGDEIGIYSDFYDYGDSRNVFQPGYFYISNSPITYSAGGDNSGSLLPGGESDLSGIISGLSNTINEFIPYLVYLGLGIITALIGFVAIRWLINRTSSKVRGTFSSGRRRR